MDEVENVEFLLRKCRFCHLPCSNRGLLQLLHGIGLHKTNGFGECEGSDPTKTPEIRERVKDAFNSTDPFGMRVFTLVDTSSMSVTLFEAKLPPVAALLCVQEGDMQRVIACFYDYIIGTCYWETVLRMMTSVLEQMSRVPRVRFGMKRKRI